MRRVRALLICLLGLAAIAAPAQPYRPDFRPDTLKGPPPARANQVAVLGVPHFSNLPDRFDPARIEPVLARLKAWAPDAIAIEALSGLQCDALRRYPTRYQQTVDTYCADPADARAATGLDVPAAMAAAERMLAAGVSTPAERRRLAALFLAAGEGGSALVQWLRLDPAERRATDGLTEALTARLERLRTLRNEDTLLAAVLAARLGHERLWPVDDHSADLPPPPEDEAAWEAAIGKAWDNPATKARAAADRPFRERLDQPDALLEWLRAMNAPGTARLIYESDFGAAFLEPSEGRFGRRYLGQWETRNLRMVANIREVLARRPGIRLLAIVGASHRGYYEAYLHQMHDVQLVDAGALLR